MLLKEHVQFLYEGKVSITMNDVLFLTNFSPTGIELSALEASSSRARVAYPMA